MCSVFSVLQQFLITIVNQTSTWNAVVRLPHQFVSVWQLPFFHITFPIIEAGCSRWCANINIIFWMSISVGKYKKSGQKLFQVRASTYAICYLIGNVWSVHVFLKWTVFFTQSFIYSFVCLFAPFVRWREEKLSNSYNKCEPECKSQFRMEKEESCVATVFSTSINEYFGPFTVIINYIINFSTLVRNFFLSQSPPNSVCLHSTTIFRVI